MDRIGTIRIKSFGTLLPPNSLPKSSENLEIPPVLCEEISENSNWAIDSYEPKHENKEFNDQCPLSPQSVDTETNKTRLASVDCVDLTEDTFETPIKKYISKTKSRRAASSSKKSNENKSQKKSSSCLSLSKQPTLQNFFTPVANIKRVYKNLEKELENKDEQSSLQSIFTPETPVKRAPKKLGKPLENNETISHPRHYDLRKNPLRRKLLKTDEEIELKTQKSSKEKKYETDQLKKDDEGNTTRTSKSKLELQNNENNGGKLENNNKRKTRNRRKIISSSEEETKSPKTSDIAALPSISCVIDLCLDSDSEDDKKSIIIPPPPIKRPATVKSEKSICPSYKVIEGTTFAVDGFKYGRIEGVTAYFLTHYHSDHYIGLTKRFSMPLYVSQITANLMQKFIPVDEKFVHILPMNTRIAIEGVQVTAIDANHCPGAVMLLFQLENGKRILHTGDFRASIEMESDPHLKERLIDLLYLDTTYISHNYSFQTQEKSIADALQHVRDFKERNKDKHILFVIGAYLVGKEKFWLPIAKEFDFKIWTDSNRRKIMEAIDNQEILQRLVNKAHEADLHIISMGKVGYRGIEAYWEEHCGAYDMVFAIRPSGWEKNSKPQFRGQLNIVGIEYSEHSSHNELRRFLSFLRPQQVISTVPYGKDLTRCPEVPLSWYKKECFSPIKKQASMLDYLKCSNKENTVC